MSILNERIEEQVQEAVKITDAYFFTDLDFSPESLEKIEELFEDVNSSWPYGENPESISKFSNLWGCYLGEVFRRHHGGEWSIWEDSSGKTLALSSTNTDMTIFPLDKVHKRFVNGPEDSIWAYYRVMKDLF